MAERSSYQPGTPCWVDLGTPDAEAAARFYGGLFGWEAAIDPRPEAGGYGMFTLGGRNVAGVGPQMGAGPPSWSVYVSVSDLEATAARITARGGQVVHGPMDVLDAGRMVVATDDLGSPLSLWQPGEHIGAQVVNQPGAFVWNELGTAELARSTEFYTSVFGWALGGDGASDQGASFTVAGQVVCGAHATGPGEPTGWSVWFSVEDCDASARQATDLGGSVVVAPDDMGFGRGAVVADPHGAAFGIGAMKAASGPG
ncbi:MAG: VOC family protein [Acidimicrobiales bacterium]